MPSTTLATRRRLVPFLPLLAVTGLVISAPAAQPDSPTAPLPVVVSILPQAGFVAEIGGDQVAVSVLVGPGHSPATYEPTPRQMATLSGAEVFFAAGVPFERGLVPRVAALPEGPLIAGPRPTAPARADDHGHEHGHGLDPHSWLDPLQAAAFADTVCARLADLRPAAADAFSSRRNAVKRRLAELDAELAALLAPCAGREFFVFHPAYGHFARRYGLAQVAVEEAGHEPGARRLAEVTEQARAAGARVIVVQPQFSRRSAEAVAAGAGAEILVLDPLAADYETNLRHIAGSLAAALKAVP